jgi:hypothetical protein
VTEVRHNVVSATWASMDADLLRRVRRTSVVLGIVMAIPFAFYVGWLQAIAWIAGTAWSLANLAAIHSIVKQALTNWGPDRVVPVSANNKRALGLALAVKFPLLYAAGAAMLVILKLPVMWWMAGFLWPFFVAVMKSAGRLYLRLDETT